MGAAGMPDGVYMLGTCPVTVADGHAISEGHLAGSVLTMDRAIANLQKFTGTSLATAVRLASANPAAMLGVENAVAPGQPANFNIFDADGQLQATILDGIRV
jgi:N-acetylglucosamine-6-phosphate deacetylase